jgi:hypothetical protein
VEHACCTPCFLDLMRYDWAPVMCNVVRKDIYDWISAALRSIHTLLSDWCRGSCCSAISRGSRSGIIHHHGDWGNGAGSLLVISQSSPIWGHLERMYARVIDLAQPGTRTGYTKFPTQNVKVSCTSHSGVFCAISNF